MKYDNYQSAECNREILKIKEKAGRVISMVSHDLKSPMTAISGFAAILKEEAAESGANPKWINMLERIERAAASSLELIGDILALAKMEAGREPVDMDWVENLGQELGDIAETFRMEADAKKISIRLNAANLPPVYWDMRRIRYHVINNIISNALKFTPAYGTILITVNGGGEGDMVSIEIEDNGPGVPLAERERIFHRFEQADLLTARVFKGAGLGLANAALFVKRHGGSISVEDAVPHGARFVIRIPRVSQAKTADHHRSAATAIT